MQRSTILLVATALAGATLTLTNHTHPAGATPACAAAPLRATIELDRRLAITRTTYRQGCTTLGDALAFGPALVQYGPASMPNGARNTVTITPVNDPRTSADEATARARLGMTNAQVDAQIDAFLHGRAAFTPVASTTQTVTTASTIDTRTLFTQLRAPSTARPVTSPTPLARGDIYDAGCVHDTNYFDKYGCYRRHGGYTPTTYMRFLVDDVQAMGRGNSRWKATALGMRTAYGNAGTVIEWAPAADVSVGSCRTVTSSIGFQGTGVMVTTNVCPNKLHPTVSSHAFRSEWQGGSTGASEGASGIDRVAIAPKSAGSGFSAHLTYDECLHAWGLGC